MVALSFSGPSLEAQTAVLIGLHQTAWDDETGTTQPPRRRRADALSKADNAERLEHGSGVSEPDPTTGP